MAQKLELPQQSIPYVYFPEEGLLSIVVQSRRGEYEIEAGIIGRESLTGMMVVMGDSCSPNKTEVQVEGHANRIESARIREAMEVSTFRNALLRYVQAAQIQTSHTVLANGKLKLSARLARCLLMCHDRMDGDEIPLTHEFLSVMIGARRAGVTVALNELEHAGTTKSSGGSLRILDRDGLKEVCADMYGVPEAEYQRLTGVPLAR
ncbi:Crp/Fnr family transcriptional regulator [Histidinibacterium aquaticum]|nr:Crp/Fnr family transcriptional regulator [Histidinibacterium aquaticum]